MKSMQQICRRPAADLQQTFSLPQRVTRSMPQRKPLLQTCRIPVCHRNRLQQICGREEQAAGRLQQKEILLQTCCILVFWRYRLRQGCRSAWGEAAGRLPQAHTYLINIKSAARLPQQDTLNTLWYAKVATSNPQKETYNILTQGCGKVAAGMDSSFHAAGKAAARLPQEYTLISHSCS